MENVKHKIIAFWLTHVFLRRIGKRYPEYHGYYIVPTTGTPYVILVDTPCDLAFAVSSAAVAVATTDETEGD